MEIKALKEDVIKQHDSSFLKQIFPEKSTVELILTEEGDTLYAINDELELWKYKYCFGTSIKYKS